MTDLVVIVSSLNRATLLRQALSSLVQTLPHLAVSSGVLVFDAGSTDGSQSVVAQAARKSSFPIRLLEQKDVSFSAGLNIAAKAATQYFPECRYFLLFETDNFLAAPHPVADALNLLESHNGLGAAGFTTLKHNGSAGGFGCPFPTWLSFILGPQICSYFHLDRPIPHWEKSDGIEWSHCDVVYTSPLLIRRTAWEKTEGMDAETFPFSDCDLDWAWRLRKSGLMQVVLRTDAVVHDNQHQLSQWSARRALHFHRARWLLLKKHRGEALSIFSGLLWLRHAVETAGSLLVPSRHYFARVKKRAILAARCFSGYA